MSPNPLNRRRSAPAEMAITEAELRAMTRDMNELHAQTFPQMKARLAELGSSRRGFLMGTGAVGAGLLLSACGSDSDKGASGSPSTSTSTGGGGGDNKALATNASLENLAVFAYGQALKAAPTGKFGKTVPAAVAEFAMHAMKQHQDHADAFNAALTNAGGQAYTKPDPAIAPMVISLFGKVDSVPSLATLALTLENTAAATYTKQMGEVTSAAALAAIATIAPVERQHAAILHYVLGEYPVPDTFVKLDATSTSLGARPSSDAGI